MRLPFPPLAAALAATLAGVAGCAPEAESCNTDNVECGPGKGCDIDESPRMLPGSNCLACHTEGVLEQVEDEEDRRAAAASDDDDDEELYFSAAGTVFVDEVGSAPAEGVIVRIFDSAGNVVEGRTNSAGNFYTSADLVFPITAEIERDGLIEEMERFVDYGGCNRCHQCEGEAEAKLYAP